MRKYKIFKRLLIVFLTVAVTISGIPINSYADYLEPEQIQVTDTTQAVAQKTKENNSDDSIKNEKGDKKNQVDENISKDVVNNDVINEKDIKPKDTSNKNLDANISDNINKEDSNDIYEDNIHIGENDKIDKQTENVNQDDNMNCGSDDNTESDNAVQEKDIKDDAEEENINDSDDKGSNNRTVKIDDNTDESTDGNKHQSNNEDSDVNDSENIDENTTTNRSDDNSNIDEESDDNNNNSDNENLDIDENIENQEDVHKDIDEEELSDDVEEITDIDLTDSSNLLSDTMVEEMSVVINNVAGRSSISVYIDSMMIDELEGSTQKVIKRPVDTEITLVAIDYDGADPTHIFNCWYIQTRSDENLFIPEDTITFKIQDYKAVTPWHSEEFEPKVESRIEIDGETEIEIPLQDSVTSEYTAIIYDQNDEEMEDSSVTWSINESIDGVEVDEKTGVLTVNDEANAGSFTLTGETNNGVEGNLLINLFSHETIAPPDVIADDDNNSINGNDADRENMEYSLNDNNGWIPYNPSYPPDLSGDVTIELRFVGTETESPSDSTILEFHYNYEENFNEDKEEYPDIVSDKRGYLSVKHYNISNQPEVDIDDRYKMFGSERYDGFIMQTPRKSFGNDYFNMYDESEEGSLYFEADYDDSHEPFNKAIAMWGYFVPEKTGYYQLYAYSDDGIYGSVTIDSNENIFVDEWDYQSPKTRGNDDSYYLQEGKIYPIYMDFFENRVDSAAFKLQMSFDENQIEDVPGSYLYPSTNDLSYIEEIPVYGINVEPETQIINLNEIDSISLSATITPENATNKNINWSSSDENIANVDTNGIVTLNEIGTVTITATTEDGSYEDSCVLTVVSEQPGNPDDYFYASDNKGTLVKYYPYRTTDKTEVVKKNIGVYRDIATLPDGSLVGITENGYLYKNIELGKHDRKNITPYHYNWYDDDEGDDDDDDDRIGYFYDVNALTCGPDGDLYYVKEYNGRIKRYDIYNDRIHDVINTRLNSRGDIVFLDSDTIYYTAYSRHNSYLVRVDLNTHQIEKISTLQEAPYGITALNNKLFVTYANGNRSYVDVYDADGNKLNSQSEQITNLKQVYGAAQGIEKHENSLELIGPYDYDYFYLNDKNGRIIKYYPETNTIEEVSNSWEIYLDIANKDNELVGVKDGGLYKNITTDPVLIKQVTNNTINSLTYNNGLYYFIEGSILYAYDPVKNNYISIVDVGYESKGDLVALNGDMYFLGNVGFNRTKLMKIDFNNNYKVTTIKQYFTRMMAIAVANDTLFVSYDNRVAKVNLPNGNLYDEFKIWSLNEIFGAAQGGYSTSIITSITINGPNTVNVPPENLSPEVLLYEAIIKDQHGNIIDEKAKWSLKQQVDGVTIDSETGALSITNQANSGRIIIIAKCGTLEREKEIVINRDESQVTNIIIDGADIINVPTQENSPKMTDYNAVIKDQYGNVISQDVSWSLKIPVSGVSINSTTGLLEATNQADAGTVTVVASSNGMHEEKIVTIEKVEPEVTNITINGESIIDVPTQENSPETTDYNAVIKDQYGNVINQDVSWALKIPVTGVSINSITGLLEVTNQAKAGTVVVVATSDGLQQEKQVTIEKTDPEVTNIIIDGASSINVPTQENSPETTDYNAVIKDQYGNVMDENISWSLKTPANGVSINLETGVLQITNQANAGIVIVMASSNGMTEEKTVTIEKTEPEVTNIIINGESIIDVPTQENSPKTTDYNAVIKDQYGNVISQDISWSLKASANGISINPETGVLQVTNQADAGIVVVMASSGGMQEEKTVTIEKAESEVTNITINGESIIDVPTQENSPETTDYNAVIKDQYGNVISQDVSWSLKTPVNGVSINPITGLLEVTNQVDAGTVVVVASSNGVQEEKNVTIKKLEPEVTNIIIDGASSINVPTKKNSPETTDYNAVIKDQYGNVMDENISWSLKAPVPGVSINPITGLLEVTNQADAGTVVVVAFSDGMQEEKNVTIDKAEPEVTYITINGESTIDVPTQKNSPETTDYNAVIKDQYGNVMDENISWSLKTPANGVSINLETGVLQITNQANAGIVIVMASSNGMTEEKTVTIEKTEPEVTNIIINGESIINVPTEITSPNETEYKGIVKDQYGNVMDENISWSLKAPVPGVSINPITGLLEVTNQADAGTVIVVASSDGMQQEKPVKIEKAEIEVTNIIIDGVSSINVPTQKNSPEITDYNAVIKDQYGNVMDENISWSLKTSASGVSINSTTGLLEVTNQADAGTVVVVASSNGMHEEKIVTIEKAEPEVTNIIINGASSINVPTEITSPNETEYKGIVKDQYGNVMDKNISWSLKTPANGVSINTETGLLEATNQADAGTVTVVASSNGMHEEKIVTIEKAEPEVTNIIINGESIINVPTEITSPNETEYKGIVKNQYGNVMDENISWSLKTPVPGVSINPITGLLEITNQAKAGTVVVVATSDGLQQEKPVTIEKTEPEVTNIIIDGASSINVPTQENSPETIDYNAVIKDQYGNVMDENISWSLKTPANGVSINLETGVLQITNQANAGIVIVIASSNGMTEEKTVTIEKTEPEVTNIIINGESIINVPTEITSPNETEYKGIVKDQYGNVMDENISWSLKAPVPGVCINPITGLLEVTNQADAGTVVVVASSNGVQQEKQLVIEKVEPEVTNIIIDGADSINVPTQENSPETTDYNAVIKDQYGNVLNKDVSWSLKTPANGVSINPETGTLQVTNQADAGTVVVMASSDGMQQEKTVTIDKEEPIVTNIIINGESIIDVPTQENSPETTDYNAVIKDQYGNVLNKDVSWSLKTPANGVSINPETGLLQITNQANAGTVVVVASSNGMTEEKTVTIEKAEPEVTNIIIDGASGINVPTQKNSPETTDYNAVIKDQYGNVLNKDVSWSLKTPANGISINPETGTLQVTNQADAGTVVVMASSDGMQQEKTVTIDKEEPIVTNIIINGESIIDVPTQENSPETTDYNAVIKDQYGNVLNKDVSWSLKTPANGVSINPETGLLQITNQANAGIVIVMASSNGMTEEKTVTIEKTEAEVTNIIINGESIINVPTEITSPNETEYKGIVKDQYGNVMDKNISWSLKTPVTGVSINLETGLLEVTNQADAGTVIVVASSDGMQQEKPVKIEKAEIEVTNIIIDGVSSINVPTEITSPNETEYKGIVKDQYGNVMDKNISWSLKTPVPGVNINLETGLLEVTNQADASTVTVVASSNGVQQEKQVAIEKAESEVTNIIINGESIINVPTEITSPNETEYKGIVKDQYGNVMDKNTSWSLKTPVTGVSINTETGLLEVTNQANAGTVTVVVSSNGVQQEKQVAIEKTEPEVTNIIIDGVSSINVPTQKNSPETIDYNAVIKDQYGNVMDKDVSWSLKIPVTGVSINSITGLLEVTNQADAGTVVVMASSNGMTEEKTVTIEKTEPEVTNIIINGESIINVPTEITSPKETEYKGIIKDQYGNVMDENISWSLKAPVPGVSINPITGLLEVTNQADAGTVTVVASSNGIHEEKIVTIEKAEPEVTNIIIDGVSSINVPTQKNSPETIDYNAVIKDQYGNVMDENISWSIKIPVPGVSINPITGLLEVTNQADAGTVIVVASSDGIQEEKIVTIEKTEPEVTYITINGESTIDVPIQKNSPETTDYNAVIKDQYGNVMDENISWSLKTPVTGVSINLETGLLEVTNQADAGTVIVVASSDGIQEEKIVTIEKAELEVTNIIINGESIINVPTEITSPNETEYKGIVKDQYGNVMDENISWSLKAPVPGVSINPITGLLEVTNQADAGTVTVVASSNGMHEEKIVTIEKAEPEVTNIIIDGADNINVPTEITSPNETEYKGIVKDQYGNVMDEDISWSLKTPVPGVSINPETGILLVTNQAHAGTIIVVASSDGMEEGKNVTIDKAEPEVTYITINGESTIDVPTQKNSPETTDYNAVIKDQYGNVMDKDVSWSLKIPVTGVSINSIPGLLEVTNQADAGTLVVVASSNGMTEEKTVTIEKAESEVTNIIIDGASSINVPTQKNSPETTDYNAVIKDQYGNVLNKDVSWSLKTPANGVSINPETGLLQVTNQADAGTVVVMASSDGMQQEKTVTIDKEEPIATNIIINGESIIDVPTQENSPETTDYNAVIKDQYGNVMDENISWSLKTPITGISINPETGLLQITNQANAGTVIVVASSNGVQEEKTVTIEKVESEVTNIIISGESVINVPTEITSPKETEYTGIVKDQYGNVMDEDVSWSLKTPANGVSINPETGTLQVTNQADAGTVIVVVSSNGVQQEKQVAIEKTEPEVTNIIIDGASSINVPTQKNSPETTDYNAVIKDQYGNVLNKDVSWSLKTPANGVSINPETGLLQITNQANAGTVVVVASSNGMTEEKTVTIEKAESEVTNIIIDGASSINVPTQKNSPEMTDYNAVIKDQYGNIISQDVSWSLKIPVTGVSINAEIGTLQVTNQANAGTVVVVASSNGMTEEKTVTIEKAEPEVTNIIIDGASGINVPTQKNSPETTDYNAVIKDQYGNVLNKDVSWSLKTPANGISINPETGTLQVTNQADAGTVVVMASSDGMQQEKTVTIDKEELIVTNIIINGESIIDVPTQENSPETTDYNAVIKDQYGNVMDENISWSLKTPITGISINPETGLLEVTNQANAGTVVVVASSNGMTEEKTVTIEKAESEVTNIIIDGASSINVPTQENSPEMTDYNAVIKDQYGNIISQDVSWSLKIPVTGVSINAEIGTLQVTNQANAGTVVVVASSNGMTEEKTVTIEKAEPEVTNIIIDGASGINVPTQKNSPETTDYNAVIKDQYGNVLNKDVSWSLKTPANGISINPETGTLQVTNQANAGTVVVVASRDGLQEEKTVTIEKEEPIVTNITINGESIIDVPTQENSPETTDYNAVIKDQYGNVMDENISWSLKTPITGISINPETGLLEVTNQANAGTVIVVASSNGVQEEKTVTIEKVESEVTNITIDGESIIDVPTQENSPKTTDYNAVIKDQYGNVISQDISWSLKVSANGISINPETGVLQVTNQADAGIVVIMASSGGMQEEKTVTIEKAESEVTNIIISGESIIDVPTQENSPETTDYNAVIKDQYGNVMDENISWSLKTPANGVSINPETGTLQVTNQADAGTVIVVASRDGMQEEKPVTIEKTESEVTNITINGESIIDVPTQENSPETTDYNAVIKDQYGNVISQDVSWSLKTPVNGVSINPITGLLEVTNQADAGTVVVVASSNGMTEEKTVTIEKAESEVTNIIIDGASSINVPTQKNSPETTDYNAVIKDQYGNVLNKDVSWSLKTPANGISINPETGVLQVTNQADAGIVVVMASSGGMQEEKTVTIEKAESEVTNITISGESVINVPTEITSPKETEYTGIVKDQYGNVMDENISWSLKTPITGISINPETGLLGVTNQANAGTVTVVVSSNGVQQEKQVAIEKTEPEVTNIIIDGASSINVPTQKNSPETIDYNAVIKDQYGNVMDKDVSWSLKIPVTGVSINSITGLLKVTNQADAGTVVVMASSNGMTEEKTVTIEKAESEVTNIIIDGASSINVPTQKNSPETTDYNAVIKDQYGNVMDENISWSLKAPVPGVSINPITGLLEVTNQADAGTVVVVAFSNGVQQEKQLAIEKVEPEVTNIIIDGADSINVPTQENSPETTDYNAVIKDQYGNVMDKNISWSLKTPANGVSINTETGLLEATNQADAGTVTVVASSDGMQQEKPVKIEKAEPEVINIIIDGADSINVPTEITSPNETEYKGIVKDQYGNVISQDVSWSLKIPVKGVSINPETGLLKVTNDASYQLIIIMANVENIICTKLVKINKIPILEVDDELNVLLGIDGTMEYSLDNGNIWFSYEKEITFPGCITVKVRYKGIDELTPSESVEVIFTKNTPSAPNVTGNDNTNKLIGADGTMEYSKNNGNTWISYEEGATFSGNVTVQVRYKGTELLTVSEIKEVIFTKNNSSSGGGGHKPPSSGGNNGNNKSPETDETDNNGLEEELIIDEPTTPLGAIEYYDPYIKGFPDGSFKPDKAVTRAEVAAMFARILNLNTEDINDSKYTDVSSEHWANKYIQAITKAGIFKGYTDGTFKPNEPIKRYEIAIVFSGYWDYVGAEVDDGQSIFTDISGHWAQSYINKLYNAGVVNGFGDKTFRPDTDTAREQIVVMINKIIARPTLDTVEPSFTDVTNGHWAFGNIEAASVKFNKKSVDKVNNDNKENDN